MHYLSEEHILLFLVQIFILLSTAKIIGGVFQKRGFPPLAGEILTGILLGPTILGRAFPEFHNLIFPQEIIQQNMLETISWLGVLFLLLVTGFEVSLTSAIKQGKAAFLIGIIGVIMPFLFGMMVFWWLPSFYWGGAANRLSFTLFMATAASISAIAVIARILHDLEIIKSDFGLTTLSGFVVNDLIGWLVFAFVLGYVSIEQTDTTGTVTTFFYAIIFGVVCLTMGSKIVSSVSKQLNKITLPHPATILTFITCLAMFCGAVTQWIGIHAILGFFLAGVMAGNASEISERTREIISQMVHAVFVPIFFASIGLKVDFVQNLDIPLVIVFSTIAIAGKFFGAWVGALAAKMSRQDSMAVGIAFIPGGAMEIVLALLALELNLISETAFVAIVFAALFSSVAVGPLLVWSLKKRKILDITKFLLRNAFIIDLQGKNKRDVLIELCTKVAENVHIASASQIFAAVERREEIMGTGLEKGIAVPHGRLPNIDSPIIIFGRSLLGIDWNSRDGLPSHFIFLLLTPQNDVGTQLQILAAISRSMSNTGVQSKLIAAENSNEMFDIINKTLKNQY